MSKCTILCVAVAVASVGMLLVAAPAPAQEGKIYEIVSTAVPPGVQFCDCMRFDDYSPGCLSIDGLGRGQLYAHTNLNQSTDQWQSSYIVKGSTCGMNPPVFFNFGVAFHGQVEGIVIMGDAINDIGVTFTFSGFENPDCSLSTCVVNEGLQQQTSPGRWNPWGARK